MSSTELSHEDELALLHGLTQHDGWKLYHAKWSKLLKECENSLLAQDNPGRDWSAGLVTGYKRLLGYPSTRIETLQKELAKKT